MELFCSLFYTRLQKKEHCCSLFCPRIQKKGHCCRLFSTRLQKNRHCRSLIFTRLKIKSLTNESRHRQCLHISAVLNRPLVQLSVSFFTLGVRWLGLNTGAEF
jgi:hypothetical protein